MRVSPHLESLDPAIVDQPSMTPVGLQTYGSFLQIRVFDMWVHTRDCALPLGIELADGGATAEQALNEVHRSMGYIAGKKIGLEDGMSMTVNVTGGAPRTFHLAVDGRAALVDAADNPTVTLTADTETFVMLACGRVDPQERIDAGRISWSGDAAWGEKAAHNLRFHDVAALRKPAHSRAVPSPVTPSRRGPWRRRAPHRSSWRPR